MDGVGEVQGLRCGCTCTGSPLSTHRGQVEQREVPEGDGEPGTELPTGWDPMAAAGGARRVGQVS